MVGVAVPLLLVDITVVVAIVFPSSSILRWFVAKISSSSFSSSSSSSSSNIINSAALLCAFDSRNILIISCSSRVVVLVLLSSSILSSALKPVVRLLLCRLPALLKLVIGECMNREEEEEERIDAGKFSSSSAFCSFRPFSDQEAARAKSRSSPSISSPPFETSSSFSSRW